jgi:eight-cysteine-cluster-containing protein
MEDGTWACTEMACQPVEPPRAGSCAVAADCMRGGCSGQLCVGLDDDGASTCEWRDEYACYAEPFADCGCFNGRCAWAPSEALDACVADANQR